MIKNLLKIKDESLRIVMTLFDEHPLILVLHFSVVPFTTLGLWLHNWSIIIPFSLLMCGPSLYALLFYRKEKEEMKIKFLNVVIASLRNPFIFVLNCIVVSAGIVAVWLNSLTFTFLATIAVVLVEGSSSFFPNIVKSKKT